MNKGTIYYDNSSRGLNCSNAGTEKKRGRWVGEKYVNGRRLRFRSTDQNKVLAWLDGRVYNDNLVELKNTRYKVDVATGDVYGQGGRKLKIQKDSRHIGYYRIRIDGKPYQITANRIFYAAQHGIDVRKIPSDIVVLSENGTLKILNRKEFSSNIMIQNYNRRKSEVKDVLKKRKKEIELLIEFYENKSKDVFLYSNAQMENIVKYICAKNRISWKTALDVAAEAIENFSYSLERGTVIGCDITSALRSRCKIILSRRRKMVLYNDNKSQRIAQ